MGYKTSSKYALRIMCRLFRNMDGFTLLELMVVFVLVTLILGLSAFFYSGTMPSGRLNAAAREITATIRHARSLSQIKAEKQVMTIDLDSRRYGIEGLGYKNIPSDTDIMVVDPLWGDVRNGIYRFVFRASGGVQGGTIVLWNKNREVKIYLDPVVGAAAVR